jgi:quinol monooxygenase YgiN
MVLVIARAGCAPERREELVELARWMQNESRQEPGCIRYAFYASLEDPTEFVAVEEWESMDALQAHFQAPSVAAFGAKLGDLLDRPPEVNIHAVEKTTDFPNRD